jgi:hypothetical protein
MAGGHNYRAHLAAVGVGRLEELKRVSGTVWNSRMAVLPFAIRSLYLGMKAATSESTGQNSVSREPLVLVTFA